MDTTLHVTNLAEYLNAIIPVMREHIERITEPEQSHLLLRILLGEIGDGGAVKDIANKIGWGDVRLMKALRGLEALGIVTIWKVTVPKRTRAELRFALAVPTAVLPTPTPKSPLPPPVASSTRRTPAVSIIPLFGDELPVAAAPTSAWGPTPPKAVMKLWDELQGIDPSTVPGQIYKREAALAKSIAETYTPDQIAARWADIRAMLPRNGRVGLQWLANNLATKKGTIHHGSDHPDVAAVTTTARRPATKVGFFAPPEE